MSTLDDSLSDIRAGQSSYSESEWRQRLGIFLQAKEVKGEIIDIKRPTGGASAASIIFSFRHEGTADPVRYVARLKPDTSFWKNFDVVEQFTVQQALNKAGLPVPAALWLDAEGAYLGRPGYIMEFATGIAATAAYFGEGPLANLSRDKRFRMLRNMIRTLADLHSKADPWMFPNLAAKGYGNSYLEREINTWFELVEYARPELVPHYVPIRDWLVDTAPEVPEPVFLHGDYQGSNVLWTGEEVTAIIDFEGVRVGPRETDLAYHCSLDDISMSFISNLDIELPTIEQRAEWYEEASGVKLHNLEYHYLRTIFQMACGTVSLARNVNRDLTVEPTPWMNFNNQRVLALLPKSLPFEPSLPVLRN